MVKLPVQFQEVGGERFVKVRVPIAINERGEWVADGFWSRDHETAKDEVETAAAELGFGNTITHFIYALVPVPRGLVIAGELEREEKS